MTQETSFEAFLNTVKEEAEKANNGLTADMVSMAANIGDKATSFLADNGICAPKEFRHNEAVVAAESWTDQSMSSIGYAQISELLDAANIPEHQRVQAAESVALVLGRSASSGNAGRAWADQCAQSSNYNPANSRVQLENLLPASVANTLMNDVQPSQESFGVGTDQAVSDMKVALTVTLMKYHTTLTPRILAVQGATQPTVMYTRETIELYDLDDTDTTSTTSVIDLYEDPALVKNELKQIVPLDAEDTAADFVVADGVLAFDKDAPLLQLSIDASKYGYGKINRTDIVADNVKMESVQITLDDGIATAEVIRIDIPTTRGRLTRLTNGQTSRRSAEIRYKAMILATTPTAAGGVSVITAKITDADDAVIIDMVIHASIDLRTGICRAMGTYDITAGNVKNETPDSSTDTLVTNLNANKVVAMTGYTLDARFSEENLRKSNLAGTVYRSQLAYDIPTGRNFIMDYALGDNRINAARNVANLNQVIRIGQDSLVLDLVEATLTETAEEVAAYNADPDNAQNEPGRYFAAGGKVRPTVVTDTLDLTGISSDRDDVRFDGIKARVLGFLTGVISELHAKSFFTAQLAGATPTYRVVTSNEIMANVLGVKHTHDHLTAGNTQPAKDDVELTLVLPNGTVLEVITTTFYAYSDKMVIVPKLPGQPKSELNFGCNHDFGTMVANYAHSGDGAANARLFANSRELPVPTNVIGAVITVTGLAEATFRA